MGLDKFEIWVHDHVLKNDKVRHALYALYQRALYMISPKFDFEGKIQKITPEDGFEYLFGYYDKCPWSDDGKYLLALKAKNASAEADSAKPAEIVRINVETKQAETLATTKSWNVQQGCMAQWLSENEILYNDFRDGKYCAVVLNVENRQERMLEMPVYAMSADRKTALTLDFSRLHRLRPGYGYANLPEATKNEKCPDAPCIWKMDIASGKAEALLNYTDFAAFEPRAEMENAEHKVNHLMISPNGKRFMVLHRWFQNGKKFTRLVTCNMDGTDMYNLSDDDFVSHCCWKNDEEILSYLNKKDGGKGYYLMRDKTQEFSRCWKQLAMDGHPTYSYDGQMVVTDTYPNRKRIQSLYVMQGKRVKRVAQVFSPFKYGGDTRCDLHPRWSKDGTQICFDASFGGKRSVCTVQVSKETAAEQAAVWIPNEKAPKVSIIIPCYNCEALVDETLENLEMQTCKDFEVICVNDGSIDRTESILKAWQEKKAFDMKVITQENGGVSKARNHGLEEARGEYIMFLDSDDFYHPDMVRSLLSAQEKEQADFAYCRVSRNLEEAMTCDAQSVSPAAHTQKQAMEKLLFEMGKYSFCCYLYRRETLNEHHICFDENTKYGEDREFNWKYLCHCQKGAWIDLPMYGYRINAQSATQRASTWRKTDLLAAVKRIEAYLTDHQCEYGEVFNSYMYARSMWAVAKTFAVSKNKEQFTRLMKEYDVKTCMKRTAKDSSKLVAIASWCYLINPWLFFKLIGLKG